MSAGLIARFDACEDRPRWLARRRTGLGATDVAAVLGKHPWRSPLDVWLDKRGLSEDGEPTEAMEMGLELEPVVARRYTKRTGRILADLPPFTMAWHPHVPWAFCSPDRIVQPEPFAEVERGLELKTTSEFAADDFGEEGTDQVPTGYLIQCLWCMEVTGIREWDLAVLIGGRSLKVFHVEHDAELGRSIMERAGEWWERHVLNGETPPIDASESWKGYLERRFPTHHQPMLAATPEALKFAALLKEARERKKAAEEAEERYKNELRAIIGEHEGIRGDFFKITWKKSSDGVKVDYQGIVAALRRELQGRGMANADLDAIAKRYESPTPGSRRFTPTFKE